MPLDLVVDHLRARYGMGGTVSCLPGEHDDNFLVDSAGERSVLRVVARDQEEERDRFVLALLRALEGSAIACPALVPATDGAIDLLMRDGAGHERRSWVTTFVHGTPWSELLDRPGAAAVVGRGLAHLDQCLAEAPAPSSSGRTPWDLTRPDGALTLIDQVPLGSDDGRIRASLLELQDTVLPALHDLPRQPIHNDANPDNVLLQIGGGVGFIDFGDAVWAPRIVELAVTGSYLADIGDPSSPDSALASLIHGYGSVVALRPDELRVLPGLMRGRLALALGNALARAHYRPERAEYVLRHADRARRRMDALGALNEDHALMAWRSTGVKT
ncbi:MAG TPA: hypothetical protein DCQ36_10965 [Actinobacteria bacterium]|nr:hypothetical protein [Actinomycetota bacterium]